MDVPEIDVMWTDIPDPYAPMGARGIGEIGITGVGAAVANAIYNGTGKRIRDLPITLDKLLASRRRRMTPPESNDSTTYCADRRPNPAPIHTSNAAETACHPTRTACSMAAARMRAGR
jgi:hypothetical protein